MITLAEFVQTVGNVLTRWFFNEGKGYDDDINENRDQRSRFDLSRADGVAFKWLTRFSGAETVAVVHCLSCQKVVALESLKHISFRPRYFHPSIFHRSHRFEHAQNLKPTSLLDSTFIAKHFRFPCLFFFLLSSVFRLLFLFEDSKLHFKLDHYLFNNNCQRVIILKWCVTYKQI